MLLLLPRVRAASGKVVAEHRTKYIIATEKRCDQRLLERTDTEKLTMARVKNTSQKEVLSL